MKCSSTISLRGSCNWTGPTDSLENHLSHYDMKIVNAILEGEDAFFVLTDVNLPSIYLSALTGQRNAPPVAWMFHTMINQAMMSK